MTDYRNRIVGYGTKPASQFLANPLNHRTHPQKQRAAMAASLNELGWVNVVIENIRTGALIDGHERIWQALRADDSEVPFIQVDLAPEEEHLALAILDRITGMAEVDPSILNALLEDVQTTEPALQELLAQMAEEAGIVSGDESTVDAEPQIDKAEELRVKWGVETGQLWELGEHRIVCGDSTDKFTHQELLGKELFDFMVTSPPYNVGVQYDGHDDSQVEWDEYSKFLESVLDLTVPKLKEGRAIAWNIGTSPKTHHVRQHLLFEDKYGLFYYRQMVWKKVGVPVPLWFNTIKNPVARQFTPNFTHEIVLIFVKGVLEKGEAVEIDPLCENDVFEYGQQFATRYIPEGKTRTGARSNLDRRSNKAHPAAFPVRIPSMFINHMTGMGEVVFEPFLGSGTTLIACEQLGRKCRAIEISPGYVAVALQRWADATGKEPKLMTS